MFRGRPLKQAVFLHAKTAAAFAAAAHTYQFTILPPGQAAIFPFFPAQAGVCNRFAVNAVMHALSTVLDIAFNHQALDDSVNISVQLTGMHDILRNADLLQIFLPELAWLVSTIIAGFCS